MQWSPDGRWLALGGLDAGKATTRSQSLIMIMDEAGAAVDTLQFYSPGF